MAVDEDTKVQLVAVGGRFDVMAPSTARSPTRMLLL